MTQIATNYQNEKKPPLTKLNTININLVSKNKPIYTWFGRSVSGLIKTSDEIQPVNNTLLGTFDPVYTNPELKSLVKIEPNQTGLLKSSYDPVINRFVFSEQMPLKVVWLSDVQPPFSQGHIIGYDSGIDRFRGYFENRFLKTLDGFRVVHPPSQISYLYHIGGDGIYSDRLRIRLDPTPKLSGNLNFGVFGMRNVRYDSITITVDEPVRFLTIDDSYNNYDIYITTNVEYVSVSLNFNTKYKRIAIYNENAIIAFDPISNLLGNIYFVGKVNTFNIIRSESKYIIQNREINGRTLTV